MQDAVGPSFEESARDETDEIGVEFPGTSAPCRVLQRVNRWRTFEVNLPERLSTKRTCP
jgi:hypothetical protein